MAKETRRWAALLNPARAFYSRELYRAVGTEWRGAAASYTLCVILFAWCLAMPAKVPEIEEQVASFTDNFSKSFPEFSVDGGVFSCGEGTPLVLAGTDGRALVAIDPDGVLGEGVGGTPLVIRRDSLRYEANGRKSTLSMSQLPDIDKAGVCRILSGARDHVWWFAILASPLFLLLAFLARMLANVPWAVLAFAAARILGKTANFSAVFRICSVAATPAIIIPALGAHLGVSDAAAWWAGGAATLFYTIFGLTTLPPRSP